MKPELILASNNKHKIAEIQNILTAFRIISLNEINFHDEIVESGTTFEQNALLKCQEVFKHTSLPIIADDSGLCVQALNMEPGVYSARYAGLKATDQQNYQKLLANLNGVNNRKAKFVCVICYFISPCQYYFFTGELNGTIAINPSGTDGFGYDPIFIPNSSSQTLANFTAIQKNKISHRAKALKAFQKFMQNSV